MNELQQVLLIFAIVVIAGLYFLSRSRQNAQKKEAGSEASKENASKKTAHTITDAVSQADVPVSSGEASYQKASQALNELGEPHIPVSKETEARVSKMNVSESQEALQMQPEVNENQGVLPFGDDFMPPSQAVTASSRADDDKIEPVAQNELGGQHHVLEVDDPGLTSSEYQYVSPEKPAPTFGVPEKPPSEPAVKPSANNTSEPQIFVIMVMSTGQEFSMVDVNKALLGVGLIFNDNHIYVKRDNMNNNIIKVANLLEPGTFPSEQLENCVTTGVAMILELPTTVKAPAAMHDLIMMARKVSQRLQGRLYNMERQLIKESDLQRMRDAAVEYESEPL